MTGITRFLFPIVLLALIGPGCAAISSLGEASQPLEVFELQAPEVRPAAVRRNIELVVEEPASSGSLATERIMIRPNRLQAQYLPGVRWGDLAPVMVQTLLVRSLTDTGAFRSVGRVPVGTLPDYSVLSELTDFQAETSGAGGNVRIRIVFRIVLESEARVVASRAFTVTEPIGATDIGTVVGAFDRATARLLEAAIAWIVADTPALSTS